LPDRYSEENKFNGYLGPISKENEAAAWEHINKVVDESLGKYRTTFE